MNSRRVLAFLAVSSALILTSCSGVNNGCTVNCGGGGSASLNVTLAALPLVPPPSTSILSFAVTISGISLTPSTGGSDVNIPLNATTYSADLTRVESDSSFLGQVIANIPAGTYNKVTVGVSSAVVTYCTAVSGVAGCKTGSLAQIVKGPVSAATPAAFSLTLASGQQAAIQVRFNFANAITVNAVTQQVTGVDLSAANVLTAVSLPPAASSLAAGQTDFLDDLTGVVTATTSTTITLQTATHGTVTSVITANSIGSPNCAINNQVCDPTVGQVASIDAALNADGTASLLEYDPISSTSVDIIEGIVTTANLSATQFEIVINDFVPATSNSLLAGLTLGTPVQVTLSGSVLPFAIDSKGLPVVLTAFGGNTSATDILPGQTVALRVTNFVPAAGNVPAAALVDAVVLRFTRVAGNVTSVPAPHFSVQSLPPFFGQSTTNQVQLGVTNPSTYFDGYSNSSGITVGDNVSMRVLYFGLGVTPSFTAAKVRKQ
jgi:hypothetical protein